MRSVRCATIFTLVVAPMIFASAARSAVINVPGDQPTIQDAIDIAVDTDEIVIAPGTYFETINFLGKAITVRSSDGRDLTIIDAQQTGSVVTCDSGEGLDTVLEGFTITGGTGTVFGSNEGLHGGGMLNDSSSPTVNDCVFEGNTARRGGGMANMGDSTPTVTNCTFIGNNALDTDGVGYHDYGGAMVNRYGSNPTVTNCTFSDNTARGSGGGIYSLGGGLTLIDCTFSGNTSITGRGGGMFNQHNNPAMVTNCTFSGNHAASDGGGMETFGATVANCTFSGNTAGDDGGGMYTSATETVINCTFIGNSANGGGGMYIGDRGDHSPLMVIDCIFQENTAAGRGGGVVAARSMAPTLTNCTFVGNTASDGGGMYNHFSDSTVTNCSFSGNTATDDGGGIFSQQSSTTVANCTFSGNHGFKGGGIANFQGSPTVTNCTFSGNTASMWGGGIDNNQSGTTVADCILWNNTPYQTHSAVVSYSNVQGGFPGTGNIDADPLFVDPINGDFRLSPGSPCIDAGDSTAVPEGIDTDLDGNPRFVDDPASPDCWQAPGTCGGPPVVDMGAYEFSGVPMCPWDIAGPGGGPPDGTVAVNDFLELLATWGCVGCPGDFLDPPGVGQEDVQFLLDNWGTACPQEADGVPPSLPDEIEDAGLQWPDDWYIFTDCITSGTPAQQDNCVCWLSYYLDPWAPPGGSDCPGDDPFGSSFGPLIIDPNQRGSSFSTEPQWETQ